MYQAGESTFELQINNDVFSSLHEIELRRQQNKSNADESYKNAGLSNFHNNTTHRSSLQYIPTQNTEKTEDVSRSRNQTQQIKPSTPSMKVTPNYPTMRPSTPSGIGSFPFGQKKNPGLFMSPGATGDKFSSTQKLPEPVLQSKDQKAKTISNLDQPSKPIQQTSQKDDIFSGFGPWTQPSSGSNNTQNSTTKTEPIRAQPLSNQPVVNGSRTQDLSPNKTQTNQTVRPKSMVEADFSQNKIDSFVQKANPIQATQINVTQKSTNPSQNGPLPSKNHQDLSAALDNIFGTVNSTNTVSMTNKSPERNNQVPLNQPGNQFGIPESVVDIKKSEAPFDIQKFDPLSDIRKQGQLKNTNPSPEENKIQQSNFDTQKSVKYANQVWNTDLVDISDMTTKIEEHQGMRQAIQQQPQQQIYNSNPYDIPIMATSQVVKFIPKNQSADLTNPFSPNF